MNILQSFLRGEKPLFLGGYNRTVILFKGNLPQEVLQKIADHWLSAHAAKKNSLLGYLEGIPCQIQEEKTFWRVIPGGRGAEPLSVLYREYKTLPSINTTNGAGHWIAVCTPSLARDRIANKKLPPLKEAELRKIANSIS